MITLPTKIYLELSDSSIIISKKKTFRTVIWYFFILCMAFSFILLSNLHFFFLLFPVKILLIRTIKRKMPKHAFIRRKKKNMFLCWNESIAWWSTFISKAPLWKSNEMVLNIQSVGNYLLNREKLRFCTVKNLHYRVSKALLKAKIKKKILVNICAFT